MPLHAPKVQCPVSPAFLWDLSGCRCAIAWGLYGTCLVCTHRSFELHQVAFLAVSMNVELLAYCLQKSWLCRSLRVLDLRSMLKGTKRQHCGQMRYVVKYKVRKMTKSLLKHHCYCPMLLMRTTKTAVCLQTQAIFITFMGFNWCFSFSL